ncbi:MAG: N-6 DNA methylase [Gemmatimonadota bacterium]|nr:N-6 DNA methylase [Gemmatimonadota bacterium]
MLDTATKRRIDTARDILVGKVPDPKSQVEQITIALIYKFMDDIDAESEELGGQRTFFAGDFARYGWPQLVRAGLGGHETLNLYAEAITRMPENPGIPLLFRDIFNNAYLPYRDPETLRAFLKVIDEFTYDHSERLGDAFEYLLSVLGSQGDAGQFRTPRHIIDFIVSVIDPKKDEKILDPACGTAGFLISSYKHILKSNTDDEGNSTLTPDEKGRLADNFNGYDISPDMVRLSLVNLYLHDFREPHIFEYDTLTSEERWNEYADVILANPPFMSPKGGIRPHRRFSVQSKRSEVLFVDYIAEHLNPTGRAGIIVPEGIIFQSQTAHKQLRKMLVENYLVAVVSLPAGVFQPYSGVKTSILLLDKALAQKTDRVAFFKVENDGFDLGAQRREIAENDLPQVRAELGEYLERLRAGESVLADGVAEPKVDYTTELGLIAEKEKIAESGEYNLSGERYRESSARLSHFLIVSLGEVAEVVAGQSPPGQSYNDNGVGMPFYQGKTEFGQMFIGEPTKWTTDPQRFAESDDILMSVRAPVGPVNFATQKICIGRGLAAIRPMKGHALATYIFYVLRSLESEITGNAGAAFASINKGDIENIQIPLPPLEMQREIVAEIEGYQRVIDGARAVIDNYRPQIVVDPEWPMVELGDAAELTGGYAFKSTDMTATQLDATDRLVVKIGNVGRDGCLEMEKAQFHPYSDHLARFKLYKDDVVVAMTGATVGKVATVEEDGFLLNQRVGVLRAKSTAIQSYIFYLVSVVGFYNYCQQTAGGGAQGNIAPREILKYKISLPPTATQQAIVAEIETEQSLVAANRELVERMEGKIRAAIGRVWGDG